jgi:hypothetical protein
MRLLNPLNQNSPRWEVDGDSMFSQQVRSDKGLFAWNECGLRFDLVAVEHEFNEVFILFDPLAASQG